MPAGEGNEAYINMNNVMRQLGCRQEAFDFTWMQLEQAVIGAGLKFERPTPIDAASECSGDLPSDQLEVVCVKYGTKYGADYVNKLFNGIRKNLKLKHVFTCFTDNSEGLDHRIKVKPLKNKW